MKKEQLNQVETGTLILARVAIMGAKRGTGWRHTWYEADAKFKSGYRYVSGHTSGMYPNKANDKYTKELEESFKEKGTIVVIGRPHRGQNAPEVI